MSVSCVHARTHTLRLFHTEVVTPNGKTTGGEEGIITVDRRDRKRELNETRTV